MGTWHRIDTSITTITDGTMDCHTINGKEIVLTRIHGEWFAFDNLCSHAEGYLVDGWLEGHEIECPLHGARFDVRSGAAKCLPATCGIATYPVKLEGDAIYVEV